jgi:DNA polymerase-4
MCSMSGVWGTNRRGSTSAPDPAGAATVRSILHADLDAFYASVEQRDDPSLRGRPMMVGGGVVLAASYEARARGIRTAMSGSEARRLCPEVIEVPPRMEAYTEASRAVFEIFRDTTPEVEGLSIDEAFLDVTGLWRLRGSSRIIATELRRRVQREVGLAISVGGGSTKFLAKVASAVSKPNGLLIVPPGGELEFLHPLPVRRLWGVGPVTAAKLEQRGLFTVADIARLDEEMLSEWIGRGAGAHLHALANNRDPRRVDTGRRRRSIGSQRSFPRGSIEPVECDAILLEIVDRVTRRLRTADRLARTVVLRLRFGDFQQATRSRTLPQPTSSTDVVLATARSLLREVWPVAEARGLTKLGISLSGLIEGRPLQLAFDFDDRRRDVLDETMDSIRERFGTSSIRRTRLVRRTERTVPLLPD